MPDGRVGHVEVLLGDSVLMMADEFPEMGLVAPAHRGGVSQSLRLEVADPDAVVAAAVAAGGTLERPVADSPYGRGGVVLDPSGHRWMVSREAPAAGRAPATSSTPRSGGPTCSAPNASTLRSWAGPSPPRTPRRAGTSPG